MSVLHPVTLAAARHRLEGAGGAALVAPPDGEGWARVQSELSEHGLTGLLAAAYQDGGVALTDEQAESVADRQMASAAAAVEIEAAFLEALDVLEPHGLPVRVLKGVASAHLDYPDPTWRTFGDVDVLVRSADIDGVVAVLTTAGYLRDLPERRAGFDRRFGKDIEFHTPNGLLLDLHRTFAVGSFGLRLLLDELWDDAESFCLGGRSVKALIAEDRLLQACFAAVFGNRLPRAGLLRDVAQLLVRPDLDAELVWRRAVEWRCLPVVAAAIHQLQDVLGVCPRSPLMGPVTERRTGRGERALLGAYPNFGGSHPLAVLSGVVAVRGLSPRVAFLRGLLSPTRAYRRARAAAALRPEWRLGVAGLGGIVRRSRRAHGTGRTLRVPNRPSR